MSRIRTPLSTVVPHLYLHIVQARNLLPNDSFNGLSDPYCICHIEPIEDSVNRKSSFNPGFPNKTKQKYPTYRTSVCENTLSPTWYEEVIFHVPFSNHQAQLVLNMWDADYYSPDDFQGRLVIPLPDLASENAIDQWYPLQPRQGIFRRQKKNIGEIRLLLQYIHSPATSFIARDVKVWKPSYDQLVYYFTSPSSSIVLLAAYGISCDPSSLDSFSRFTSNLLLSLPPPPPARGQKNAVLMHPMETFIKILIHYTVQITMKEETLFRTNTLVTKLLTNITRISCKSFLKDLVSPIVDLLVKDPAAFVVSPEQATSIKQQSGQTISLEKNQKFLQESLDAFLKRLYSLLPMQSRFISNICTILSQVSTQKFPKSRYTVVAGYLFLRVINPAIVAPDGLDIVEDLPIQCRSSLITFAKVVQNLANRLKFENKEIHLAFINPWLESKFSEIRAFMDHLCERTHPTLDPPTAIETTFKTLVALHKFLRFRARIKPGVLDKLCDSYHYFAPNDPLGDTKAIKTSLLSIQEDYLTFIKSIGDPPHPKREKLHSIENDVIKERSVVKLSNPLLSALDEMLVTESTWDVLTLSKARHRFLKTPRQPKKKNKQPQTQQPQSSTISHLNSKPLLKSDSPSDISTNQGTNPALTIVAPPRSSSSVISSQSSSTLSSTNSSYDDESMDLRLALSMDPHPQNSPLSFGNETETNGGVEPKNSSPASPLSPQNAIKQTSPSSSRNPLSPNHNRKKLITFPSLRPRTLSSAPMVSLTILNDTPGAMIPSPPRNGNHSVIDLLFRFVTVARKYTSNNINQGPVTDWDQLRKDPDLSLFVQGTYELQFSDVGNMTRRQQLTFFCNLFACMFYHLCATIQANLSSIPNAFQQYGYRIAPNSVFTFEDIINGVFRCNLEPLGRFHISKKDPRSNLLPRIDMPLLQIYPLTLYGFPRTDSKSQFPSSSIILPFGGFDTQMNSIIQSFLRNVVHIDSINNMLYFPTIFFTNKSDFIGNKVDIQVSLCEFMSQSLASDDEKKIKLNHLVELFKGEMRIIWIPSPVHDLAHPHFECPVTIIPCYSKLEKAYKLFKQAEEEEQI